MSKQESKTVATAKAKPGCAATHGSDARRDCAQISNDISENLPVTKSELMRVLKWERHHSAQLQNTINRLRDAMVKVGLVLSWTEPPNPKLTDCIITISKALKHPNDDPDQGRRASDSQKPCTLSNNPQHQLAFSCIRWSACASAK